jgi:hypothetical protein
MYLRIGVAIAAIFLTFSCLGQTEPKGYSDFPIIITLQFHAFALPFRDLKSNFSNVGIGVGTEVSFTGKETGVQQVSALWYHNKAMGNGVLLYTQSVWRPYFSTNGYGEIKGGLGYLYSFRPSESFQQVNGEWKSKGRKGKGMLTIPLGVSVGYDSRSINSFISGFASYQFLLLKDYNKSIPLVPETILQVGSSIH